MVLCLTLLRLVLNLGRYSPFGLLSWRFHLGRRSGLHAAGEPVLVGTPIGCLRRYHATRLGQSHRAGSVLVGQIEDYATLEPVYVATNERIGVAALDRHEHLLKTHAILLGLARNLVEGIATLDFIVAGSLGLRRRYRRRFRRRRGLGDRRRHRGRRACLHSGRRHWRSGARLLRLHCRLGLRSSHLRQHGLHVGGIEQEGVLPHQATRGPIELDQHIDKRLVDRLRRRKADEVLP